VVAPDIVKELVERFDRNIEAYRAPTYNEAQTRQEFINPMFKALGWDMENEQGYAEAYKDVIHEDAIKVGGATKAPDYCFRVGGTRKFFLEAKKPYVNLIHDEAAAFQLRRYAWSAKLPLSILTDFEEFVVYDCRLRPSINDKPSKARILSIKYRQYGEKWEEIESVFSREAVLKGSFDKFAQSTSRKRGTAEVDKEFLAEIEMWRELLARNIALRNKSLTARELNYAVQLTIDRIIFLRICEDRGIEEYARLKRESAKSGVYKSLFRLFSLADQRYNSGLFHFRKEKGRPSTIDTLTPNIRVDDKPLKEIIKRLYYPESPYEFSVLPADILGHIYEQFLGKVISLTKGHQARIEEKPEVRKAGGVYYTPTYIVDYIVKNTVGKLLEGKSPGPKGTAGKLRVLDPACGSGSFLLVAFQHLLDWHLKQYTERDSAKWARGTKATIFQDQHGEWRLTTSERKRILLNNIYGVDIDPHAVEVTKLSLLLRVLEEESAETIDKQLQLLHERALPDLGDNIKCGNSLIAPDYFDGFQADLFDDEERYRVNVFDWNSEFKTIMKQGGFDAVIGNPPYIRIQTMQDVGPEQVSYLKHAYRASASGNYDIYVVFVEKGLSLLGEGGLLGFILPHKFFNSKYGQPLRGLIAEGNHLAHVVHFGDLQVFDGATTYTALLFLDKTSNESFDLVRVRDLNGWRAGEPQTSGKVDAEEVGADEWSFVIGEGRRLWERLHHMPVRLADVAHTFVGTQTSADAVFVLHHCEHSGEYVTGQSKALGKVVSIERTATVPFLHGRNIRRYEPLKSDSRLICPYSISTDGYGLLSMGTLREEFPCLLKYLEANRHQLESREKGRFCGDNWYAFGYPKSMTLFQKPKLVVPDYSDKPSFTTDDGGFFFKTGYGVILKESGLSPLYILGLLNSTLLFRYLATIGTSLRGGYLRFWSQYIEQLPIRVIDFGEPADVEMHSTLVRNVQVMLDLHRRSGAARTQAERQQYQRQMKEVDRTIEDLVLELYEVSASELTDWTV
jgi:type I restriction-modification system DNA methylase subunit